MKTSAIMKPTREEILYGFAVEPSHDKETLETYLKEYPEYAEDLVDLSYELNRVIQEDDTPLSAEENALIDDAWRRYSNIQE